MITFSGPEQASETKDAGVRLSPDWVVVEDIGRVSQATLDNVTRSIGGAIVPGAVYYEPEVRLRSEEISTVARVVKDLKTQGRRINGRASLELDLAMNGGFGGTGKVLSIGSGPLKVDEIDRIIR